MHTIRMSQINHNPMYHNEFQCKEFKSKPKVGQLITKIPKKKFVCDVSCVAS